MEDHDEIACSPLGSEPESLAVVLRDNVIAELTARVAADSVSRQMRNDLVRSARAKGATWSQIGLALGITRQGAHKLYGRPHEAGVDDQALPF